MNKKIIKFFIVGMLNTAISFLCYALLIKCSVHYLISNIISYLAGFLNSYILNKKWVFKKRFKNNVKFIIFILYNSLILCVSSILLFCFVNVLSINKLISQCFVIAILFLINYNVNNKIIFIDK